MAQRLRAVNIQLNTFSIHISQSIKIYSFSSVYIIPNYFFEAYVFMPILGSVAKKCLKKHCGNDEKRRGPGGYSLFDWG